MVTELDEITACGQSVQTRGVEGDGTWTDETFMDDFELAFYMCAECGEEMETFSQVKKHLAQGLKAAKQYTENME